MQQPASRLLIRLIWFYIVLWIFEGALRLWVVPSLSGPLLIARSPLAALIYLLAAADRKLRGNLYVAITLALTVITVPLAIFMGHGSAEVAAYGVLANFFHIPLIFVIGSAFSEREIRKLATFILLLSIPMALIAVKQFRSAGTSLINAGSVHTHYGTVRPAGTFSYVGGMVAFLGLLTAFLGERYLNPGRRPVTLAISATAALLAMVAVSGSRSAVVSVTMIATLSFAMLLLRRGRSGNPLIAVAAVAMVAGFVTNSEFYGEGVEQLKMRFRDASGTGSVVDDVLDRIYYVTLTPLTFAWTQPLFGNGIGYGTNAGAMLLVGRRVFLLGEGEWSRIFGEMGPLIGLVYVGLRVGLAVFLFRQARIGFRLRSPLPVLLFGASWLPMVAGQWGVPTDQGFAIIAAGLTVAAARVAVQARNQTGFRPAGGSEWIWQAYSGDAAEPQAKTVTV